MAPPISVASRREMASPRPVPPKRRVIDASACENGANMRCSRAGSMPMPVSRTTKRSWAWPASRPASSTSTDTVPTSVNLMALPTRLTRICCRRGASPIRFSGTWGVTPMASSRSLSLALTVMMVAIASSRVASWNGAGASSSRPASILEKSSTSLRMLSRDLPDCVIMSRYLRWSGDSSVLCSRWVMPSTALSGVRISWLMLATNSVLARLAASACSLAASSELSERRRAAVMSSASASAYSRRAVSARTTPKNSRLMTVPASSTMWLFWRSMESSKAGREVKCSVQPWSATVMVLVSRKGLG